MQTLLEYLITDSIAYSLTAVTLVAFLESLALVGLILPGTVIMAGFGALIGSGEVNFWQAWMKGIIGCLLGDWVSFWLGWRFKRTLRCWSFMKKNKALLDKTEHALYKHSMFSILIGRFIGPMRPLVPMVAGMLELPVIKFIIPNIIGCILWPPFYFLPGILAGAAVDILENENSASFKWLLLLTILFFWLITWLFWYLWRNKKINGDYVVPYITFGKFIWFIIIIIAIAIILLIALLKHPLMPIYSNILLKVISH